MSSLFEIDQTLQACVKLESGDYVDTTTGEIIDINAIEQLQMSRNEKIRNIACWIRNLDADENALADQIKIFTDRKNAAKSKREQLKSYLAFVLAGEKWQNHEVSISWRKSEAVQISPGFDVRDLPEQYLKYKLPDVDKITLKADLKAGKNVSGASLVTKNNIQIR